MSRNKSLLEYHLDAYEKGLVFQIVHQDDLVTNYIKRIGKYQASNGYTITIDREPEIDIVNRVIYLRGRKDKYDLSMHRNMNAGSNKEIKKKISAINSALTDLVQDAKGDRRKKPFKYYDQIIVDLREFEPLHSMCNDNRILVIK